MASRAKAADLPVTAASLDYAKQALSGAAPVLPENNIVNTPITTPVDTNTTPDGFLNKPLVAETTTRQEPKPVIKPVVKTVVAKPKIATQTVQPRPLVVSSHRFPYGYCTYYVAQKRSIPWGGNAGTWLSGARSFGFSTGSAPQTGAIMVTYEGGRAGHVAYVESVNGDGTFTVSEMNYRGFGVVSSRTIPIGASFIKGFIY